ncbi:MAG TPA: DUF6502 family protein [Gammaproteobacteria bacterium]
MQTATHESPSSSPSASPALRFLGSLLRPIVRMCMRLGVSANQANDLMRWLFVDEFYRTENLWHRRQPFASRAALLSGLSRKEVARLRSLDALEDAVMTERHNRALRVLSGWRNDRRFLDETGNPRPLPLKSDTQMASFHTLVGTYSGDVPPRTVLDELRRANCIREEGDTIVLTDAAYGPYAPDEDFLPAIGMVLSSLGDTADFNIANQGKRERHLMRVWYQNNIPAEHLAEVEEMIREASVRLGRQLDSDISKLAHRERQPGKTYVRAGMGAFFFQK